MNNKLFVVKHQWSTAQLPTVDIYCTSVLSGLLGVPVRRLIGIRTWNGQFGFEQISRPTVRAGRQHFARSKHHVA